MVACRSNSFMSFLAVGNFFAFFTLSSASLAAEMITDLWLDTFNIVDTSSSIGSRLPSSNNSTKSFRRFSNVPVLTLFALDAPAVNSIPLADTLAPCPFVAPSIACSIALPTAIPTTTHKAAYLEKFRELLATKKSLSLSDEFYYSLGWLARHSGTVKAVVPDICEAEFVQYFGTEVPFTKTEYKVGPGGWISQWGKSFTASLVKVKTIPAYLEQYLNPKRTQITNSEYIKDLVDNYGFQFGKAQNVEAIRQSVPAEYLPHFEAGFAA